MIKDSIHGMVDLETLGTGSNSVVVSVGLVAFNVSTGDIIAELDIGLNLNQQIKTGGVIDGDTLEFHFAQAPDSIQKMAQRKVLDVKEGLDLISNFIKANNLTTLWGNGATFDNVILRNLYARHLKVFPLGFWTDRDLRTAVDIYNIDTRTVNVGFRFLGKIENITKDEGEIVKKDEVLVKLDTASLEKSLEELNEKIFASKLELSKLQTGYRQEEILEAKAAMEEAIENLNKTKDTYNRQTNLFKTKSTSEENFTISQLNYKQALATLDKAKALYELRKNGYRDEDIKIQESNLKSLEIQAEKLKIDLNDSVIKAPVDGVILTRFKEIGAITNAGESILEIAKTDEFWVRAYIDEKNLGNIKPGLKMSIQTDSRSENYEGVIGFISPVAEFTPKNIETQELRADLVYSFRVIVKNPDDKIRQGMPVTLKIAQNNANN